MIINTYPRKYSNYNLLVGTLFPLSLQESILYKPMVSQDTSMLGLSLVFVI
jgi:hypothetical protein